MSSLSSDSIKILGPITKTYQKDLLSKEALEFLAHLQRTFNDTRESLLAKRIETQKSFDQGQKPNFSSATENIRNSEWKVATPPADLTDRRVEITGPTDRKMMINALNSGAKVFMADLEDSLSPSWLNVLAGQYHLSLAIRKNIDFQATNGKSYTLKSETATLVVRPRGWHLEEYGVTVDGKPMSASLFDFGLYLFHNAKELISRGSGPYFYLPKIENHHEARLWNEVFKASETYLGFEKSIKATVLIETITAAFDMEEILYELKDYIVGLNAGRWDYIFSVIKRFREDPARVLPDRKQVTMTVPFMEAYTQLLVNVCHKRGAHAIGGMSAFIPSRKNPEVNTFALDAVSSDKETEAMKGFDGTWVAHPDLVDLAKNIFDQYLGQNPHQKNRNIDTREVTAFDLMETTIKGSAITEEGLRVNTRVAIQYLAEWLNGSGAVAINNLMEDAATAEISRAQIWQWIKHRVKLDDGRLIDRGLYQEVKDEELQALEKMSEGYYMKASELLDHLVLRDDFPEFLTLAAYQSLQPTPNA